MSAREQQPIAVLGPGGVGGFVAAALARAGDPVLVIARGSTARVLTERGIEVSSTLLGDFTAHPAVAERLDRPVEVLIVAAKAPALSEAMDRVAVPPDLTVPLLNGLDHLEALRQRLDGPVAAGAIRIEADRPAPGVVVHTSPFLRIDLASDDPGLGPALARLADRLQRAGIPTRVMDSEAQVMWSKLVRLNALACTTSATGLALGPIRSDPQLRVTLAGAVQEAAAVGRAEGARLDAATVMAELDAAHATLGSSMARDIAAGRPPELDAIPGAVLRAAARHGLACPTIERLSVEAARRAGVPAPLTGGPDLAP